MTPALAFVQHIYSGCVALGLYRSGVLDRMERPTTSHELAEATGLCSQRLEGALRFLFLTTNWLVFESPDRYSLSPSLRETLDPHLLAKFLDAYGHLLSTLPQAWVPGNCVSDFVDSKAMARAFRSEGDPLAEFCAAFNPRLVVDLGCGPGSFLEAVCKQRADCRGIGIDRSYQLIDVARAAAHKAQITERVSFRTADATKIAEVLKDEEIQEVDLLHGRSLLNALFYDDSKSLVRFLKECRRLFGGKRFVVVDYYSRMFTEVPAQECTHALLQDLIQCFTRQGLPPHNRKGWLTLYEQAGCRVEFEQDIVCPDGLLAFVHVLRL